MKKQKPYSVKKFINDVHLWLGLISGLVLFLVCLSGTILTFEKEIKGWFSSPMIVSSDVNFQPLSNIVSNVEQRTGGKVISITLPEATAAPYELRVKTDPTSRRGTAFEVHPETGEIVKPGKTPVDEFMMFMFRMHRWLLLDTSVGRPIVGVSTIIFLIISITGIILWFPKKWKWRNFRQGFTIKTSGNWKRINHDLHNTLGFYACVFIVIMGITGLCWSFEGYRDGLGKIVGAPIFGGNTEKFITVLEDEVEKISLNDVKSLTDKEFPYSGKITISLPLGDEGVYQIRKYNTAGWSPVATDVLVLDLYGSVLLKEFFSEKPLNVQFASLIKPIHTGEIFGIFSKWIYFYSVFNSYKLACYRDIDMVE